jgi:Na+/phosphate symporter
MMKDVMQNRKQRSTQGQQGLRNELVILHDMITDAVECILLMQNAFIYHNAKLLKECKVKIAAVKKSGASLIGDMEQAVRDNPDMKPYAPIPAHLSTIGNGIEKLSECIDKKINENILFSDKAVKETIFLLQRLTEILTPTADIVLARNTFMSMYVEESQAGVGKMATEYATLHEERLIKGVCLPVASSLYITMLNAIKSIAWNAKEIAIDLAGQ